MKKWIKGVVILLIVLILMIPIFKEMKQNSGFKTIKYSDYNDIVKDTTGYKFALIYVAPGSMETVD